MTRDDDISTKQSHTKVLQENQLVPVIILHEVAFENKTTIFKIPLHPVEGTPC